MSRLRARSLYSTALTVLLLSTIANIGVGVGVGQAIERAGAAATPTCERVIRFDADNFSNPTRIDNEFLPLLPGTQFVLEGTVEGEPHTVILTVTDLTKVIDGVRSVVLWDRDFASDQLVEEEIAFHAQDNEGNVWNLGEYPEEFEDGEFVGAPSTWVAGRARAQAGIVMLADPKVDGPRYIQGFAPEIDFLDCGKVVETAQETCVPADCYGDVVVIDETSPLEPDGGTQRKLNAAGVGNVRVIEIGDPQGEFLELVEVKRLGREALAEVRKAALRLDQRAYRFAPDVYGETPPAKSPGDKR